MSRISAIAFALLCTACATGYVTPRDDATFSKVRMGMSVEEVRRIVGPPDEQMPFPRLASNSWAWYGYDSWGYRVLFSATFGPDGRVASTFSRRLNDGGEMK